eukprot:scaffold8370_cov101-Isochrysis_galbana.AAC.6
MSPWHGLARREAREVVCRSPHRASRPWCASTSRAAAKPGSGTFGEFGKLEFGGMVYPPQGILSGWAWCGGAAAVPTAERACPPTNEDVPTAPPTHRS